MTIKAFPAAMGLLLCASTTGLLPAQSESASIVGTVTDSSGGAVPGLCTYGNAGRNILIGPGAKQFDLSLFKKFALGKESRRIEPRAEAFNLMNTPQFNNPNASIGSASAGVVSSAGNIQFFQRTSRQVQLAMKLYF